MEKVSCTEHFPSPEEVARDERPSLQPRNRYQAPKKGSSSGLDEHLMEILSSADPFLILEDTEENGRPSLQPRNCYRAPKKGSSSGWEGHHAETFSRAGTFLFREDRNCYRAPQEVISSGLEEHRMEEHRMGSVSRAALFQIPEGVAENWLISVQPKSCHQAPRRGGSSGPREHYMETLGRTVAAWNAEDMAKGGRRRLQQLRVRCAQGKSSSTDKRELHMEVLEDERLGYRAERESTPSTPERIDVLFQEYDEMLQMGRHDGHGQDSRALVPKGGWPSSRLDAVFQEVDELMRERHRRDQRPEAHMEASDERASQADADVVDKIPDDAPEWASIPVYPQREGLGKSGECRIWENMKK